MNLRQEIRSDRSKLYEKYKEFGYSEYARAKITIQMVQDEKLKKRLNEKHIIVSDETKINQ